MRRVEGKFVNWTAVKTKETEDELTKRLAEIEAAAKRDREFLISRMDEDEREEFRRSERERRIDALLESPPTQEKPAQQDESSSPEQLQLASAIGGYAQAKNITLGPADAWIWEGAREGQTVAEYLAIAQANIDKRVAASATPATKPAPRPVDSPPDTTSAPKTTTVNVESMTIGEASAAMLTGEITNEQYLKRMGMFKG